MRFGIARLLASGSRHCAAFLSTVSLVALVGCGSEEAPGGGGTLGGAKLTDEHNYTSTSTLSPKEIVTASGTDLDISWDALTTDMQCHSMSPTADIGKVALLRFRNLTKEQAADLLTAGELEMSDIDGYIQYETGESKTSCKLSDLNNFGTAVEITEEYKESENQIYMLLWATGTRPGTGARTMVFLRPVAGEVNKLVEAEPGCDPDTKEGILTFTATLPPPLEIPADSTVVDWRAVTVDGLGNPIYANAIDRILVAFYADMTPEDLEERIFDIEDLATDMWEIRDFGGGRRADLAAAQHREEDDTQGDFFEGFAGHGEGTWLLGLMCSTCQNPAPMVLSVLKPVAAE
jgi:hypothetical protein